MEMMHDIAVRIPDIAKLMLTCFTSNQRALAFYQKLGYSEDECSPKPKVLRNGRKVEVEYVIWSKRFVKPVIS